MSWPEAIFGCVAVVAICWLLAHLFKSDDWDNDD